MTDKEAIFLLGACPPGGSSDPEFFEALAHVSRDPALAKWHEQEHRFDSAVAARLKSVVPPPDLRARILAGGRVSRPAPWFSAQRIWAIAAMFVVFVGLAFWYTSFDRPAAPVAAHLAAHWEDQALAELSHLAAGQEQFDLKSPRAAELQQWLRSNGSPGADLPAAMARLASIGCKTLSWRGHPISIICFHDSAGDLVHIAMVDRAACENPPPEGHPIYGTRDGWRTASWSQGNIAMMMVTKGPESRLRALLAITL